MTTCIRMDVLRASSGWRVSFSPRNNFRRRRTSNGGTHRHIRCLRMHYKLFNVNYFGSAEYPQMPTSIKHIAILCLLPAAALAAPLQERPRQLDQLKGLLGGGNKPAAGGAANPLGELGQLVGGAKAAKQNPQLSKRTFGMFGGGMPGMGGGGGGGLDGLLGGLGGGLGQLLGGLGGGMGGGKGG
ncbi:hypothetical protein RSAG8_00611, partial [Rhizoctonia solani AG-8 WAC10335]